MRTHPRNGVYRSVALGRNLYWGDGG